AGSTRSCAAWRARRHARSPSRARLPRARSGVCACRRRRGRAAGCRPRRKERRPRRSPVRAAPSCSSPRRRARAPRARYARARGPRPGSRGHRGRSRPRTPRARPARPSRAPRPPRSTSGRSRSQAVRSAGSGSSGIRCPFVSATGTRDLPAARVPPALTSTNARTRRPIPLRLADYGRFSVRNVVERVSHRLRGSLRALPGRALLHRAALAARLEQLRGPFGRDRFDRVSRTEARVRLSIGHVRAEPALLENDRLAARGVGAQLLERRRCRPAAAAAWLRQLGESLFERDREELLLGVERAGLLPLADVGAVTAVRRLDLLAVRFAERA